MKIKVVAPLVGISSWRQTHPLRESVVPAKLSACGIHFTSFPEQHDANMFQEALERMTKELTASAPCAVKN